jgi:hypothetical protein
MVEERETKAKVALVRVSEWIRRGLPDCSRLFGTLPAEEVLLLLPPSFALRDE